MLSKQKLLIGLVVVLVVVGAFAFAQVDIASKSIQFDLKIIGQSVYEAHTKSGKWPARIEDLEGTEYLNMPYRKDLLDQGQFVIVWQQNLDPNPEANGSRVLAFDNNSLLSHFGRVWVCRGDLRVVCTDAAQLSALVNTPRRDRSNAGRTVTPGDSPLPAGGSEKAPASACPR